MIRIGKFTDFYSDVTKMGTKISQERYLSKGQFPIIDQGRQTIAGRWDDEDGIFSDVPAIVFGDHTRAIKYIEEPFFIGADGVKILRPKNTQDSPKYLFYALQAARIPDLGYSRHFKAVKELDIRVCSKEEQAEIVRILESIDFLIEKRHEEVRYLDQAVKSRFVELFGATDRFETVPLADSVDEMFIGPFGSSLKNECFVAADQGYCMVYEQKHAIKKTMDVETRFVDEKKYKELRRFTVQGGDIIVSCRGTIGETFIVPEDAPVGIMHPSIMKIRLKTAAYNRVFFNHLLQTVLDRHEAEANGSGVKMAITATALGKELFIRPSMDMQEQFAAFVEQTDKSKYYSSLSFRYCQAAANTYRQEWMTCRTSDF